MRELYDTVMNENINPLRDLPKAQQFQLMMFLSTMWTTMFCLAFGLWAWWGSIMIVHVPLALGVFLTGWTFKAAQMQSHRELFRANDGTARHDDIWGG